jgi:hypothetical protein
VKVKELIEQLKALENQEAEVVGSIPVGPKMKDTYAFIPHHDEPNKSIYMLDGVAHIPMRFKRLRERK